ncbi:MAG: hypothetical protein HY520_02355 [Candidatus Aenigmarchaeota archaeon]|nr:hypothetical protein [Candidatus Aenigmarchaeota archaeon]
MPQREAGRRTQHPRGRPGPSSPAPLPGRPPLLFFALLGVVLAALASFALGVGGRQPVHWHAELALYVNGERIPVPAGVGLEGNAPIHTHAPDNTLHIETPFPERATLGSFFDTWGVVLTPDCFFQYCGEDLVMEVNGQPSQDFGSYPLRNGDLVVISVIVS